MQSTLHLQGSGLLVDYIKFLIIIYIGIKFRGLGFTFLSCQVSALENILQIYLPQVHCNSQVRTCMTTQHSSMITLTAKLHYSYHSCCSMMHNNNYIILIFTILWCEKYLIIFFWILLRLYIIWLKWGMTNITLYTPTVLQRKVFSLVAIV